MSFRVLERGRARQDILELIAHVAARNPKAATAMYDAYERMLATTLAQTPDVGRPYHSSHPRLRGMRVVRSAASCAT